MKAILLISAAVLACCLLSCGKPAADQAGEPGVPGRVFASNYPLAYFAQRLTANPEQVYFPEIEGDPAFWKPNTAEIEQIQGCALLLLNGAAYEKWLASVTLPLDLAVNSSAAFAEQFIKSEADGLHRHGGGESHGHQGTAFTTWIDFRQAAAQAAAVAEALERSGLVPAAALEAPAAALQADLHELDRRMAELGADAGERPLVASHPVYQYLARAYGLDIKALLWEPGIAPSKQQWAELEQLLAGHPAQWMLWEDDPLPESVKRLETMGITSVVFNPCGNRPLSGDFLEVMRSNLANLAPVFAK